MKEQRAVLIKGKKGLPNTYHIFNSTYEMNVYLVVGQKKKVIDTWDFMEERMGANGCTFPNNNGDVVIWLRENDLDVFVHEALHVVSYIAHHRGIKYDYENDEPLAYLLSWLVRMFMSKLQVKK